MAAPPPSTPTDSNEGPIPLPDIRDQLRRKELQQKIAQMEAEEEAKKVKIKRSDKEAFTKVSRPWICFRFVGKSRVERKRQRLLLCPIHVSLPPTVATDIFVLLHAPGLFFAAATTNSF